MKTQNSSLESPPGPQAPKLMKRNYLKFAGQVAQRWVLAVGRDERMPLCQGRLRAKKTVSKRVESQ